MSELKTATITVKDYAQIKKDAQKLAIKTHTEGKSVRDLMLDPVAVYFCETEKEKSKTFSVVVNALDNATDDQKKAVATHVKMVGLLVSYVALELRKLDGQPKTHRAAMVERLKAIANTLELGVGAVNKDAAILTEWCTGAVTHGKQTDTKIRADVWPLIQRLFTNKLNAYEARMQVGKDYVIGPKQTNGAGKQKNTGKTGGKTTNKQTDKPATAEKPDKESTAVA